MGISRSGRYKRRLTGGKRAIHQKKRKFELGRPPASTKLAEEPRVRKIRTHGGNEKQRALRLDKGNFSWGSENVTRKVRILDVVYNASNNELVRTKTLVKGAIIEIDGAEYKKFYETHYNYKLDRKEPGEMPEPESKHRKKLVAARQKDRVLDPLLESQLTSQGRLLACISSRPGQCGRADGYVLEGKELEFYHKLLQAKKTKKKN